MVVNSLLGDERFWNVEAIVVAKYELFSLAAEDDVVYFLFE